MAINRTFEAAMLILLSPSKTMASDSPSVNFQPREPEFMKDAELLMSGLQKLDVSEIETLMKVSTAVAGEAHDRCSKWNVPFTTENSKPAAYGFKGAVYTGLDSRSWSAKEMDFAQKHIRILSGLYGVLGPKDLMQPYRLEMGLKWPNTAETKNLYAFWGDKLQQSLNKEANGLIVNLASNEYSKAALLKTMDNRVITPVFKDLIKGEYKALMAYAKEARGTMAKYIVQNRITNPEEMKGFDGMGYRWDASLSSDNTWLFTRDKNSIVA